MEDFGILENTTISIEYLGTKFQRLLTILFYFIFVSCQFILSERLRVTFIHYFLYCFYQSHPLLLPHLHAIIISIQSISINSTFLLLKLFAVLVHHERNATKAFEWTKGWNKNDMKKKKHQISWNEIRYSFTVFNRHNLDVMSLNNIFSFLCTKKNLIC